MDESSETALIKQAVAETGTSVRAAFSAVLGEPAAELGGLLTDRLRYLRFKQMLKLMNRASELLEAKGIQPQQVPRRVLMPLLEAGSLEDDPEIMELWAQLLASAAESPANVPPSFPEVLRQLEPVEAKLLSSVVATRSHRENWPATTIDLDDLEGGRDVEWRNLDNLERLGLITYHTTLAQNAEIPDRPSGVFLVDTSFGSSLVLACGQSASTSPPRTGHSAAQ